MPIDVDGFAILRAMTDDPGTFSGIRDEAAKVAKALLLKQVKQKGLTLDGLRRVSGRLPEGSLSIVLDDMADKELKSLVAKYDKHNVEVLAASPLEQAGHLHALLGGDAKPVEKSVRPRAAKAVKEPKVEKPKVERAGNSRAMAAKRKAA